MRCAKIAAFAITLVAIVSTEAAATWSANQGGQRPQNNCCYYGHTFGWGVYNQRYQELKQFNRYGLNGPYGGGMQGNTYGRDPNDGIR
jgi:hypothetical protein